MEFESLDYVILSLIRELYNFKQTAPQEVAEDCQRQIERLQSDRTMIDKKQLWNKVQTVYIPYLNKLLEKK